MGIVLTVRKPGPEECARWAAVAPTSPPEGLPTGVRDLHEAEVQRQRGEDGDVAFERIRARLFSYDIFSPNLVRSVICPGPTIERGTLIVQRGGVGPLRLESAVRVVEVWDRDDAGGRREAGFRYVTLAGHPERGVAWFAVQRDESGAVRLTLGAVSQPGTLLARLAGPIARPAQLAMTRAALRRLAGRQPGSPPRS
jgi:uncharacterized protein (UPF0548 family)